MTVSAGDGGSVSTEGGTYDEGTQITITATTDQGYSFVSWSDGNKDITRTVVLSSNLSLSAEFIGEIVLTRSTITGSPDQVKTGFSMMGIFQLDDENIFFVPSDFFTLPTYPLLHLKREDKWSLERVYDEYSDMQVWRDIKKIDENNFVVADQGIEFGQEDRDQIVDLSLLDMGETYHFNFENNQLNRTTLSSNRAFFHSIDIGDLDNDNRIDIVSMYMATPSGFEDKNKGTKMNLFTTDVNSNILIDKTDKIKPLDFNSNSCGAIIIDEFTGDGVLDLIKFGYKDVIGYDLPDDFTYSYELLSLDSDTNLIEMKIRKDRFSEFPSNFGIAWVRSDDIDGDRDNDLIIYMEEGNGGFKIDSWINDSKGNFSFNQRILSNQEIQEEGKTTQSRDFEMFDFDDDGDLDLFVQPLGQITYPINFSKYIYINNNGVFEIFDRDLIWDQDPSNNNEIIPLFYLKFIKVNGSPGYLGFKNFDEKTGMQVEDGRLELYEFIFNIKKN